MGFSLIELLVTMVVAAVLLGVAAPGFVSLVQNNRSTVLANQLVTALNLARTEAIRRGVQINVCSSSDGATCTGNWVDGWIVIVDGGPVLHAWPALENNAQITQGAATGGVVQFGPLGAANAAVVFNSEYLKCKGDQARTITVTAGGRVSATPAACS